MAARRDKAGFFINEHGNLGDHHINNFHAAGFKTCWVKCHSGEGAPDVGHCSEVLLSKLRAKFGVENVGGWGNFESHNNPIHCAWAVNGIVEARGFPFYYANIETTFGDRIFLQELRRLQPRLVIGLSCEIENPRDWAAWFKTGAIFPKRHVAQVWLPQTYLNLNPGGTPEQAVWWAQRKDLPPALLHWCPPEYVKPTFSVLGGDVRPDRDMSSLFNANAKQMGLGPGFSVYLGENTESWHINEYRKAIEKGAALL